MQRRSFLAILAAVPFCHVVPDESNPNVFFVDGEQVDASETPLTLDDIDDYVRLTLPTHSRVRWIEASM